MIIFNYTINEILDQSKIISLYRASTVLNEDNKEALSILGLSERDVDILKKHLKNGCVKIAHILSGYTKDLIDSNYNSVPMEGDPFEFDVTYDDIANSIVFRINMPESWPVSCTTLIDVAIKDALENYVVYRVNKDKGIDGSSYLDDYDMACRDIRSYLGRRDTMVKRSYSFP